MSSNTILLICCFSHFKCKTVPYQPRCCEQHTENQVTGRVCPTSHRLPTPVWLCYCSFPKITFSECLYLHLKKTCFQTGKESDHMPTASGTGDWRSLTSQPHFAMSNYICHLTSTPPRPKLEKASRFSLQLKMLYGIRVSILTECWNGAPTRLEGSCLTILPHIHFFQPPVSPASCAKPWPVQGCAGPAAFSVRVSNRWWHCRVIEWHRHFPVPG